MDQAIITPYPNHSDPMIHRIKQFFFKNKTPKQIFVKNTIWLVGANTAARLFKFFLIPYAAQVLGPEGFGTFNYALSLAAAYFFMSDMGLSLMVPRELQHAANPKQFIHTTVVLKAGLLVICTLFFGLGYFLMVDPLVKEIYLIMWLITVFDQVKRLLSAYLQAAHRLEHEAIPFLAETFITSSVGIWLLYWLGSIKGLALAYLIGSGIGMVLMLQTTWPQLRTWEWPEKAAVKDTFKKSLPFFFTLILNMMLLTSDTLLIKWWLGAEAVGYYQAGLKVFVFLFIIAQLIAKSIYPLLSEHRGDISRVKHMIKEGLSLLLLISLPLSIGGVLLAPKLIYFLFGTDYLPSILPFQILLSSLVFIFVLYLLNRVLLVYDHEKTNMWVSAFSISLNIILNIVLLPQWGILGVAMATFVAKAFDLVMTTIICNRILKGRFFPVPTFFKGLLSSVVMYGLLHFVLIPRDLNLFLTITAGAASYGACLILLREDLTLKGFHTLKTVLNPAGKLNS